MKLWVGYSALVACLVAGCAPLAQHRVTAFAGATTETISAVRSAFETVNTAYVETRTEEAIKKIGTGEKVNPKLVGQPFLGPETLQARLDVLDQLSKYAELLATLMSDKSQKELDAKVDQFAAGLKALADDELLKRAFGTPNTDGTFNPVLGDRDRALLATALNEMARIAIDVRRTRAVREAIRAMNPHIGDICNLLKRDIGEKRDTPGLRSALYISYDKQLTDRFKWISDHSAKPGGKADKAVLSPLEQRAEIRSWLGLVQDQSTADAAMAGIYRSLSQVAKVHSELDTAFEKASPGLDELIRILRDEAGHIRDRYRTLSHAQ